MTPIPARSARFWLGATTLGPVLAFSLALAATAPALAQNSYSAPDFAAKSCPPEALSLDTPRPLDLQSIAERMNVGEYKRKLTDYKCSGDYDKDVDRVLEWAIDFVEKHAGEVKQPALVLDIDETSLSNWPAILTDDFSVLLDWPLRYGHSGRLRLACLAAACQGQAHRADPQALHRRQGEGRRGVLHHRPL